MNGPKLSSDRWYHLAATFDGTTVKAYLDGVEKVSVVGTTTAIRSNSIRIGTSGGETNNFFSGIIDEVLVYSRALNASEISGLDADALLVHYGPEHADGEGRSVTNASSFWELTADPKEGSEYAYCVSQTTALFCTGASPDVCERFPQQAASSTFKGPR